MILIHQLIGISTTFKNILLIQNIALKQKHLSNLQQHIIEKDETKQDSKILKLSHTEKRGR